VVNSAVLVTVQMLAHVGQCARVARWSAGCRGRPGYTARVLSWKAAAMLGVPLVHGAIGGYTGQVTIFPGDPGLRAFYGQGAA
jgi:hypothetical protein